MSDNFAYVCYEEFLASPNPLRIYPFTHQRIWTTCKNCEVKDVSLIYNYFLLFLLSLIKCTYVLISTAACLMGSFVIVFIQPLTRETSRGNGKPCRKWINRELSFSLANLYRDIIRLGSLFFILYSCAIYILNNYF